MQLFFRLVPALCAVVLATTYAFGIDAASLPRERGAVTYLDRGGDVLGTVYASDSMHVAVVPFASISPHFVQAIVDTEDARFGTHGAVDVRSFGRAVRELLFYGSPQSGGSTIDMQLARLLFPVSGNVSGKLRQIVDAERLALRSEHTAILEAYLNRIPMGGNHYGVEAAARSYFDTPAAGLDLAQASLLAAIPNDPTRLDPRRNFEATKARRRLVLARMMRCGDARSTDADRAEAERLRIAGRDPGITDAPQAILALFRRSDNTRVVRTTIDRDLQRFVQAQTEGVVSALSARHVTSAAAIVVDNTTGGVLAYVGSPDYYSEALGGQNDGVVALRQPGSSLKPFTYELALERGTIASTSILEDAPVSFALAGGRLYQPADYSGRFSGPVRVRYALANSLNVPAVRVLAALGPENLLARLHELGFSHLDKPAAYYGLGLTLGGGEVSLWELAQAYATMARFGNALPLRMTVADTPAKVERVGDRSTWTLVTDMLADRYARAHAFGVHSVLDLPFDAAVKTGTSSDFRDTWTVGFTRDYTVAVWVGNFDGSPMREISGVTGAGPLWNHIFLHLYERNDPAAFALPEGYVRARICATTGVAPRPDCGAVVSEWVRPHDLDHVTHRTRATAEAGHFRIAFPHEGDAFVLAPAAGAVERSEQLLHLRADDAPSTIVWAVDGKSVPVDSQGQAYWAMKPGNWTVTAASGPFHDSLHIHVRFANAQDRPGFSD